MKPSAFVMTLSAGSLALAITGAIACSGGHKADAPSKAKAVAVIDAGAKAEQVVPSGPPKKIYAKKFVVTVRSAPNPDAPRIGYLRAGAIIQAKTAEPVNKGPGCLAGFYELETGGFVCNVRDVIAFDTKKPPERPPAQPDREALLPYQYAINRRDNTPMYRRLPSDNEAAEYEGYHIPGSDPVPVEGEAGGGDTTNADVARGIAEVNAPTPQPEAPIAAPADTSNTIEATAGDATENLPPTLASLMGERGSVLMRRMVKGFYVSLDRDFHVRARRYWRTISNGFIPYARLSPVAGSHFDGQVLDGTTLDLPGGFVMRENTFSYRVDDKGRVRRGARLEYRTFVRITGEQTLHNHAYFTMGNGDLVEQGAIRKIERTPPPAGVAADEKWIDVDLTKQCLVAYIGEQPVFTTLISSGKVIKENDPLLDHATPVGDFRITSKHIATAMDGDHAVDGPYSIEDVPYVMYFELAYALHSAFWHNRFGYPKSHGCVNLSPTDARWMFNWTLPFVPQGWHGAYPTEDHPGTRVIIHGEAPHRG